jgi:hypothetical protein
VGAAKGYDGDSSKRTDDGRVIDDFEQLYKAIRLAGAEQLIANAPGQFDETGHSDTLPTRVTGSDETVQTDAVALPEAYQEAAAEAMHNDQVPPAYREAVKTYFDGEESK